MQDAEKRRKERRWHLVWIDWVILGATVLLALLAFWWLRAGRNEGHNVNIVYTVSIPSASNLTANANGGWEALMPIGASVANERGSRMLGRVEAVTVRPTRLVTVVNGRAVFLEEDGRDDLYVLVDADAVYREGDCYRVGDLPILCGTSVDLRIGNYFARGCQIVGIEERERK